ncbi:NADH-quinone oxidoreductase subunit A [Elusimicrobiota bacterium]
MHNLLLSPPVAFLILLIASILASMLFSAISFKNPNNPSGKLKAYACGEEAPTQKVRPSYGQFFSFAFFFTIMHVLVLVIATAPVENIKMYGISALYIAMAITGLFVLLRRDTE